MFQTEEAYVDTTSCFNRWYLDTNSKTETPSNMRNNIMIPMFDILIFKSK